MRKITVVIQTSSTSDISRFKPGRLQAISHLLFNIGRQFVQTSHSEVQSKASRTIDGDIFLGFSDRERGLNISDVHITKNKRCGEIL